jgi:membrane-associated phospholipid phosphatase
LAIERICEGFMKACLLAFTLVGAHCYSQQQVEPDAGNWKTWVVPNVGDLRLPAPPRGAAADAEIELIKERMRTAGPEVKAQITYWDSGSPGYRWEQLAAQELQRRNPAAPLFTRALALLNVAIYDATIVAWDSKFTYNRLPPHRLSRDIKPLVDSSNSPSYPSEHAVAAGAASAIFAYLFPDSLEKYNALAQQAAQSRVAAGANYPSDVVTGFALGYGVGRMVIEYAMRDQSDLPVSRTFPLGDGFWGSPTPVTPQAGMWKPWVLSDGSQYRLPQPPPASSTEFKAQVAIVKNFPRTNTTNHSAWFWQPSFSIPWLDAVHLVLLENHLDRNGPRAARVYALATIAQHDATIACWDTKYAFLELRPSMADPTIEPLFGLPQHPGFPSGHACASGASSIILGALFPQNRALFAAMAQDAGSSTFYAAIHTQFDVSQGLTLGENVGRAVAAWAASDGSQQPQ